MNPHGPPPWARRGGGWKMGSRPMSSEEGPDKSAALSETLEPSARRRGAEADALLGTCIGSFRLTRKLGQGGMGAVYLGEHVDIGSRVAIKVLHGRLASSPQVLRR